MASFKTAPVPVSVPASTAPRKTAGPMATVPAAPSSTRLTSLDALRGFDMCWILGLDAIIKGVANHLKQLSWVPESVKTNVLPHITGQLTHVEWRGLVFYDLIFPLFLFLSGVSMAISVSRRQQQFGTTSAAMHLVWRRS